MRDWYLALPEGQQARVRFHFDRSAEPGPLLGEPHTRQLQGKLRELRFFLAGRAIRVTYWIAPGRRIVLLTVFMKARRRDGPEIRRAGLALVRSQTAGFADRRDEDNS